MILIFIRLYVIINVKYLLNIIYMYACMYTHKKKTM